MCHRASRRGFSLHSLALSLCQPEDCGLEQEELGNIVPSSLGFCISSGQNCYSNELCQGGKRALAFKVNPFHLREKEVPQMILEGCIDVKSQ